MYILEILFTLILLVVLFNLIIFALRQHESMKRSGNVVYLRITMPKKDRDQDGVAETGCFAQNKVEQSRGADTAK